MLVAWLRVAGPLRWVKMPMEGGFNGAGAPWEREFEPTERLAQRASRTIGDCVCGGRCSTNHTGPIVRQSALLLPRLDAPNITHDTKKADIIFGKEIISHVKNKQRLILPKEDRTALRCRRRACSAGELSFRGVEEQESTSTTTTTTTTCHTGRLVEQRRKLIRRG